MRQLLYISSQAPGAAAGLDRILAASRRNNAGAGVTGLLYAEGRRFLQVLEGEEAAVAETFERIRRDPGHRAVVVLSDRAIDAREFGEWAMAHPGDTEGAEAFDARLDRLLAGASGSVRGTFRGLVAARRAA